MNGTPLCSLGQALPGGLLIGFQPALSFVSSVSLIHSRTWGDAPHQQNLPLHLVAGVWPEAVI